MLRRVTLFKMFGNLFVVLIAIYMALQYYAFAVWKGFNLPEKTSADYLHLLLINILFPLAAASFFQTVLSDPGRVPLFWGFFLDDPDHKRRRYCLICHIFKPERCHHCSACNRCVLNMDHHCPWLNNCIGFYNRKFFLLLLFYGVTSMFEIAVFYLPQMINLGIDFFDGEEYGLAGTSEYVFLVAYLVNLNMLVILGMFFSFHVKLVIKNMTTIEWMDKKRSPEMRHEQINYDMGVYYNFIQIFGKNPALWFIPISTKSGKPVGDGVVWPQKPSVAQTYENDDKKDSQPDFGPQSNRFTNQMSARDNNTSDSVAAAYKSNPFQSPTSGFVMNRGANNSSFDAKRDFSKENISSPHDFQDAKTFGTGVNYNASNELNSKLLSSNPGVSLELSKNLGASSRAASGKRSNQ